METIRRGRPFAPETRNAIMPCPVMPAQAGIQWRIHSGRYMPSDSRFRGNDGTQANDRRMQG